MKAFASLSRFHAFCAEVSRAQIISYCIILLNVVAVIVQTAPLTCNHC